MKVLLPLACFALGGCISTAASIITAPVKMVGWTADKLTTSQSEADQKRGRAERKAEEKRGREARKAAKKQPADTPVDDRT